MNQSDFVGACVSGDVCRVEQLLEDITDSFVNMLQLLGPKSKITLMNQMLKFNPSRMDEVVDFELFIPWINLINGKKATKSECIKKMIDSYRPDPVKIVESVLFSAIFYHDYDAIDHCLDLGAVDFVTAFIYACQTRSATVVYHLLERDESDESTYFYHNYIGYIFADSDISRKNVHRGYYKEMGFFYINIKQEYETDFLDSIWPDVD